MVEYPVPYEIQSGKCCAPCPHGMPGNVSPVVSLGSAFCREDCRYSGDKEAKGGEPVKCLFDEAQA
jgi:hypothetical protein